MHFMVKEMRAKIGLSQESLSKKAGVSRGIISGLESGSITETSTATLKKLAVALNCNVSDIFCS